jgi:hypothetical protein
MSNGSPSPQAAAPPPSASGGSLSVDDFAGKIKAKYPAYANVENRKLVGSVLEKYPVYKSQLKTDAIESLAVPKGQEAVRGAAQVTGMRAAKPMSVAEMADTPFVKDMLAKNVGAGEFGAGMLAGGPVLSAIGRAFKPTVSMIPEASKLLDAAGKPIVNMVEKEGPSAARAAGQAVVKTIKQVPAWMKAHPYKALAIEGMAHELGVDPIQLAHKILKYSSGILGGGTTHVP